MLSKKMEIALNKQINEEFWSAYLYLSMSAHFEAEGLEGIARWFKNQFDEEQEHAMKIFNYVIERGGKVTLAPIREVHTTWPSVIEAFEATLAHEKIVTGFIYELVKLAKEEDDFATESMLRWFVDEQVEEESTAQGIIDTLKLIGNSGAGLYALNKELGRRE